LVTVLDTSGADIHAGRATAVPGQPRELSVSLPANLPKGVYTVNWRAVSAADGHITAKAFAFGIGTKPSAPPTGVGPPPAAPGPSVLAVTGKFLLYLGLAILFAAGFVGTIAFGGTLPAHRRVLTIGSARALAGVIAMVLGEMRDVGVGLGTLLTSEVGTPYIWLLGLVVATAAVSVWAKDSRPRWVLAVIGAGASGAMLARAIGGHASAATSQSWLQVGAQWFHFMSVGAWIGGLILVVVLLRDRSRSGEGPPVDQVRRFSAIAFWSVVVLAVSGGIRAVNELGGIAHLGRLFHSSYGITLTIKIVLAALLVSLGGINRYRGLPRLADGGHLFRKVIGAEVVTAMTLFGLTATLTSLPPATNAVQASSAPTSITARGADFATTTKITLTATPGTAGPNTFNADVTDYDTGAPAQATSVELHLQPKGSQQVGASVLPLRHVNGARWAASGTNLSLDGAWSVIATVVRPSGAVQVPLTLTTRSPPQQVSVSHAPGQPDIYTFTFPGEVQLQSYVDPGTAGPSQFHVTAFQGTAGLPLASATLSVTPAGGNTRILVSTRLEADHFVANTTLSAGSWRFAIAATTQDGRTLQANFSQTIGAT
ncbi:MAG: copper transport protein, partial [Actinomycetota bacterium]|nr:copper transport protein [Actinomycetota bacterium]